MSKAYQVVNDFEQALCKYTGATCAVAVESCTASLFLCLMYLNDRVRGKHISIPDRTYPSVPAQIYFAGGKPRFWSMDMGFQDWQDQGYYDLLPLPIVDSAKYMSRNMMQDNGFRNKFVCLSFHAKKAIPIGRGGAILIPEQMAQARSWFRRARFDGRNPKPLDQDELNMLGWNMYMTPEQAARGMEFMQWIPDSIVLPREPYLDLPNQPLWKEYKHDTDAGLGAGAPNQRN